MKLLVLPPHRDVTLVPDTPEGWHLVDVARDFCLRVSSEAAVADAAEARERGPATAQTMRELLLLRAAQSLMKREDTTGHLRLRALGAVLTALSGPPSGVRLRLDDVELESGTTERSEDVLRVAGLPAPYTEELARVAERLAEAERVCLWLDRDLQLPSAVWLARACPPAVPLEIAGPFVEAHREVLARMPMFQRAVFPDASTPLRWRVAPLPGGPDLEPLVWIPESLELTVVPPLAPGERRLDGDKPVVRGDVTARQVLGPGTPEEVRTFTGGAPWGGHVGLGSVVHADALLESGCRVAVVGFCSVSEGFVLEPTTGHRLDTDSLSRGARRLRDAGVRLVAEWWVGAPGVDEAALEATLAALEAVPLFEHVAGVRPFHWGIERPDLGRQFRQASIQPKSPPADRDLARSRPFDAPDTLSGPRLLEVLESLSQRLLRRAPLNPGRVAAACLRGPSAPAPEAINARGPIRLDDDCALVQLPASLDGAPKPTWYAANLRTGTVLAMDARLAPRLVGLTRPALASDVLGAVPEAQREKLVDTLVAKAVLTRMHG